MSGEETKYLPACDGGPWPDVGTLDAVDRQKLEFLALYYQLNRFHGILGEIRHLPGSGADVTKVIASLHEIIRLRDALEDQCAPYGFDAEPVMSGSFAMNVVFRHARLGFLENHRRSHPQVARIQVPVPPGIRDVSLTEIHGIDGEQVLSDLDLRRIRKVRGNPQEGDQKG